MRTVHSPRLLPVVEIPPWRYLNHISPPEGRLDEDGRIAHWKESVAASGFTAIEPIFPGSMFVPIEQITTSGSLDAIINYELGQLDVEDGDLPCALEGGYFLYDDGQAIADPQCCASLRDLSDWKFIVEASEFSSNFWIGIGHPGLAVSIEGDSLKFRSDGPEEIHLDPFMCRQSLLRAAVLGVEQQVLALRNRFLERAKILVGERAAPFSDALVGRLSEAHEDGW